MPHTFDHAFTRWLVFVSVVSQDGVLPSTFARAALRLNIGLNRSPRRGRYRVEHVNLSRTGLKVSHTCLGYMSFGLTYQRTVGARDGIGNTEAN